MDLSEEYDMRVCGMVPDLAEKLRELADQRDTAGLKKILQRIEARATEAGASGVKVATGRSALITGAAPLAETATAAPADTIVMLVIDPYNIDSKMVTKVRHGTPNKEQIFGSLYKYLPSLS